MEQKIREKIDIFFSSYPSRQFKKNEIVLRPEEEISSIYLLKEGFVRMYVLSEQGQEVTLHIFKPVSFFPIMLVLSTVKNKYFFEAMENLSLIKAPADDTLAFLKSNPEVLFDLTHRLSDALCGFLLRTEDLMLQHSHAKVASLLLYLAKHLGKTATNNVFVPFALTHEDLASWLGLTRETVSRQIEDLTKKNIIAYKNHRIIIKDIEKLIIEAS